MTTPFTASNGDTIETRPGGDLVVKSGNYTEWVEPFAVDALREYFQHQRDEQLGRWRDPENPDLIIYPNGGDYLRVFSETTCTSWVAVRPLHFDDPDDPTWFGTAARYFAAHPEPNPEPEWYDAQSGELWILTIGGEQVGALAWRTVAGLDFETSAGTLRDDDPGITAGRRIWPEPEESDDEDA